MENLPESGDNAAYQEQAWQDAYGGRTRPWEKFMCQVRRFGFSIAVATGIAATSNAFSTTVMTPKAPDRFTVERQIAAGQLDEDVTIDFRPGHKPVDPFDRTTWNERGVDTYIAGPFSGNIVAKDTGEEKYAGILNPVSGYKVESISVMSVAVSPGDVAKVQSTPRFWIYRDEGGLKLHVWLPGDGIYVSSLSFKLRVTLARDDAYSSDVKIGRTPNLAYDALLYARNVNGCNRLQIDYLPNVSVDGTAAAKSDSTCPSETHHTIHLNGAFK